jgi:FRG domain-containing protein
LPTPTPTGILTPLPEPSGAVNNLGELITHSGALLSEFKSHEVWWRGHSRADWLLTPGVHREGRDVDYERNISAKFFMKAHTRHARCPPEGDWAGWLFLMQHYRLPTRLLDWTESSLIAAFFAATDHLEQDGVLWALDPLALNERQMGIARIGCTRTRGSKSAVSASTPGGSRPAGQDAGSRSQGSRCPHAGSAVRFHDPW